MKSRNYGIDFLRIISMYMIVILHVLGQGGVLWNLEKLSLKYSIAWLLEIFCYCSVTCYALITGYVMSNGKFRYKKIINLWLGVIFWSIILTLIMNALHPGMIGKKNILKSMFPIIFNKYWYFSAYFGLFFFIPFINKFINFLDKASFKRLILTIVILFSIIGLVAEPFGTSNGYSFIWLLSAYLIGSYIKKNDCFKNVGGLKILFGIIFSILFAFIFKLINLKYPAISTDLFSSDLFIKYNSLFILAASTGLLVLFSRLKVTNKYFKRLIKKLAPATFGVYIIHVQTWIWELFVKDRFKCLINYNPIIMILLVLFFAFILYMLCSYLEMIRRYMFKKLKINNLVDIIYNLIKKIVKKIELIQI